MNIRNLKNTKTVLIVFGILFLILGGASCIIEASLSGFGLGLIFLSVLCIGMGICIGMVMGIITNKTKENNVVYESNLKAEDMLTGTAREILQMHFDECKKYPHGEVMTTMWTESCEETFWGLISVWDEGQVCAFQLLFYDEERLMRFRNHRYYSLFTSFDGESDNNMIIRFDALDERAITIFTAILADVFDQKGNNVKACFA